MTEIRTFLRTPEACPHCERQLKTADGDVVRELDRDFREISDRLDEQSMRRMKSGTLVCFILSGANFFSIGLPFLLPLLPAFIAIQQIIWARPLISAPYAKYFSPGRRIVTRWLSRFFVFSMASLHAGGAIPGLNMGQVIASPIIFVVTCGTAWAYHRFHLQREHDREPVMFAEKILLVIGGFIALLMLVLLILFGMFMGEVISWFTG